MGNVINRNLYFVEFVPDVCEYMGDNLQRIIRETRSFDTMEFDLVCVNNGDQTHVEILALCGRKPPADARLPLEINLKVKLDPTEDKRIVSCTCSCRTEFSGKCKHALHLFMYLTRVKKCDFLDFTGYNLKEEWEKLKKYAENIDQVVPVDFELVEQSVSHRPSLVDQFICCERRATRIKDSPRAMLRKLIEKHRDSFMTFYRAPRR